jgi:hypothetical protein
MKQWYLAQHFITMQDDQDREAEEAVRTADNLVRTQETEIDRMKSSGVDASWAEKLLEAYRYAARIARERLQALRRSKPS